MKHLAEVARDFRRKVMTPVLPAHQVRPAINVRHRAPRHHLTTALMQLLPRERTRAQLAELVQARYPSEPVYVDDIVHRLVRQDYVEEADGHFGLTSDGTTLAEQLKREAARALGAQPIRNDVARRQAAIAPGLDKTLLSHSPARLVAQPRHLVQTYIRPGGDQHEGFPSRIGDRHHYRDGRVTELDGTVVHFARTS